MAVIHGLEPARLVIAAALVGLLASLPLADAQTPGTAGNVTPAIAIIVNRSNPVNDVTRDELRRIFMLVTQTWPHGRKITIVLRDKADPLRAEAIRLLSGISEADYDRHILFQTFRGTVGLGPRTISSTSGMVRFVFNAPGAIGYVPADQADGSTKVLRVDGLLPGDPRYPLRVRPATPSRPPPAD